MKILINVPSLKFLGGVANHYLGLKLYWTENVKYNIVGKRNEKLPVTSGKYWLPWDIIKFLYEIIFWRPDAVLLNPSFGRSAIIRDMIFLFISITMGKKTFIFIHGWEKEYSKKTNKKIFIKLCNKSTGIFVLATTFKNKLASWGIKTPVFLSTTKVNDRLIEGFDINSKNGEIKTLLFLARVEIDKGILIAINTFNILKQKHPTLKLEIVGDGKGLDESKKYVTDNNIKDVNFKGRLSGTDLIEAFKNGDLYIFPTYYGEGMPTSVLEAMAFGLPVITRPVGGVADFFENDKMGFITESLEPKVFAEGIEKLIKSPEKCREISQYNYKYAKEHFMASTVAKNIEKKIKCGLKS